MIIKNKLFKYKTRGEHEFEDITDQVVDFIKETRISNGIVNIQTLHTTASVVVNENEPLLLEDMKNHFKDFAKKDAYYGHNDFDKRTVNICGLNECKNGHSHCLASYLPTNITLNIVDGEITFGEWQRIFLVELDHSRPRKIQIQAIGE